jgi:NAD(P)H-dependent flavin oxidoreductase YrpB (nitropropane dioxygenase family)
MNEFAQRLGLQYPLIQAPMAGVQGSALAVAVWRRRPRLAALRDA